MKWRAFVSAIEALKNPEMHKASTGGVYLCDAATDSLLPKDVHRPMHVKLKHPASKCLESTNWQKCTQSVEPSGPFAWITFMTH